MNWSKQAIGHYVTETHKRLTPDIILMLVYRPQTYRCNVTLTNTALLVTFHTVGWESSLRTAKNFAAQWLSELAQTAQTLKDSNHE